jgi:hypothetical protein
LGHSPKYIVSSLFFSQQWGDVSHRDIPIERSAVKGEYLNGMVHGKDFFDGSMKQEVLHG